VNLSLLHGVVNWQVFLHLIKVINIVNPNTVKTAFSITSQLQQQYILICNVWRMFFNLLLMLSLRMIRVKIMKIYFNLLMFNAWNK